MTRKLFRFAYICEFLLALIAVFTAWSEIGGQAALDLMHWGWKFGLGVTLSFAFVGYTAAALAEEKIANRRTARWLAGIVLLLLAMGVVTYYYTLEEDTSDTEDSGTLSFFFRPLARSNLS
jgi:cytochrome c biogenesis protein CcdA